MAGQRWVASIGPRYSALLGIDGTLSVVELKVLQMRLLAGMEEKARRGEFLNVSVPGYVKAPGDTVVKDPDRRVQDAIALVFEKFAELPRVRQTFLWFHSHGVELPVNKKYSGGIGPTWQLPSYAFIKDLLQNPVYAGAYVWGRRPTETVLVDGNPLKRQSRNLRPEECRVFIQDHHE